MDRLLAPGSRAWPRHRPGRSTELTAVSPRCRLLRSSRSIVGLGAYRDICTATSRWRTILIASTFPRAQRPGLQLVHRSSGVVGAALICERSSNGVAGRRSESARTCSGAAPARWMAARGRRRRRCGSDRFSVGIAAVAGQARPASRRTARWSARTAPAVGLAGRRLGLGDAVRLRRRRDAAADRGALQLRERRVAGRWRTVPGMATGRSARRRALVPCWAAGPGRGFTARAGRQSQRRTGVVARGCQ